MPRPPRLDLPGIPQHVVQRGVDRRPCFIFEIHYLEYLRYLADQAERFECRVHAYALMCNHVHLLVTPADPGGVGRLMQSLGRRYVGFFNAMMERKGTLWEGRFKSCLVDSESYVLRCYRYIELNPVRAGVVRHPCEFRWSSYHRNGNGLPDKLVRPHAAYEALGASREARAQAYRAIVAQGCPGAELESIRGMTQRQRVFGSQEFREKLQLEYGREMGSPKRGRPKRQLGPEHGV